MTGTCTWTLSREAQASGRRIAWDRFGEGPPLVLIHGTPFNSHVWARIAPVLARRFTVYVYDLLGYGQSEKPADDVSLGVQNTILAALLATWGLERPRLLAHDFGGATALRAHFLNGCDYEKLMLFDPVAVRPWGSPFVAHVRDHEAAFAGTPDDIHKAMLEAYIAGAAHHPLRPHAMAAYRDPWRGETGQAAFYRQIAQMDMRFTDEDRAALRIVALPGVAALGRRGRLDPDRTGSHAERRPARLRLSRDPGRRTSDAGRRAGRDRGGGAPLLLSPLSPSSTHRGRCSPSRPEATPPDRRRRPGRRHRAARPHGRSAQAPP